MRLYKHHWKHNITRSALSIIFTIFLATIAFSWGSTGHKIVNLKAVQHLPESMASLKADSMFYYNHASDADYRKDYSDTSFFAEHLRHYIDIDVYPNYHSLPHNLDSMIMLYGRSYVRSNGTLPWAIVLCVDSLTAQLRRNNISKAESTMSDLGHYVADAHQPLHCTENYDGGMTGNSGIHSRYESYIVNTYQTSVTISQDAVYYVSSPLDFAFEYIYESNDLVDSIMNADDYAKSVSGWSGTGTPPTTYYTALWQQTERLTKERFQHATVALASLWYTAWVNAQPEPPDTIVASSVGNGSIFPSGSVIVPYGNDTTFTFAPQTGYHVDSVHIDGNMIDSLSTYTFHSVTSSHTITVWFGINLYSLTASADTHGSVVPFGSTLLPYDSSQTYFFYPDSGFIVDSVFVDGGLVDSTSSYTFLNVDQNHTLHVTFKNAPVSVQCSVFEKWNMVSLPVLASNRSKGLIYPSAVSNAFSYSGSYIQEAVVTHGKGYWLKFAGDEIVTISGTPISIDTVTLVQGWNIIGSISMPVPISSLMSIPEGLETSQFFGYTGTGYFMTDTIKPGEGYWVKASEPGKLILSATGINSLSSKIVINQSSELPPSPPGELYSNNSIMPGDFALEQNYPNPFNPTTVISYQLTVNGYVSLKVYTMLGAEVATLVDEMQDAGYKSVQFVASNLPSGVYLYRLTAGGFSEVRKAVLVR